MLRFGSRGCQRLVAGCGHFSTRKMSTAKSLVPEPQEKQVKLDNSTSIHYVEAGLGEKGLLLLPGALGTAWSDFKPQIEQLPGLLPRYKVIAWDPPGYGKSRPPDKEFSEDFYERDAQDACELMERIGFRNFSVLGWSDGGITGLIMAGTYSTRIEKLAIWGSNAYIAEEEALAFEKMRDVSTWSARMRAPMEKIYGAEGFPRIWSAWVDGMLRIYNGSRKGDICRNILKQITAPTFILHGSKDPMIIPEHIPMLMNNIRDTDLHVFPEGKHNIHLRYAEEFNKLVSDFLKK
ncbi:valacyclovir hydrolase-like [Uranotaenia lowii]|uniref:valacyclovir hydrolase-like n=1 Tax=Uranotaenia lowii TaxID=190385 RepID=UPI00247AD255|nr:valacyclovir hydrolase-like [Uranotaenia lowii]